MAGATGKIDVYLEIGKKRTFAGTLDWPGWCRGGKDEESALQALAEYGPRYARALRMSGLTFDAPDDPAAFNVVEQLQGNDATDFGAANLAPTVDARPFDGAEHERSRQLLRALWRAFDEAVRAGEGKELRKGPRGGGRDLDKIVRHLLGADASYLGRLARKFRHDEGAELTGELRRIREAMLEALGAGVRGEIPTQGPRGGALWTPRYFVRRVAWHTLDHAWEIEDRAV